MDPICEHLGIPGDKQSRFSYANGLNVCYATQLGWTTFEPIGLSHQRQFCLSADHAVCSVYLRQLQAARSGKRSGHPGSYLEFFALREEPFSIVPSPRFAAESASQREAHIWLRWVAERRQGLGVLYGEIGTGKTMLCRLLHEELSAESQFVPILLPTPNYRSEYAFMGELIAQWKLQPERHRSLQHLEAAVHGFLVQTTAERRIPVLIADESQMLSRALLQQIRKLLNWQDGGEQLLQVILSGQPTLHTNLARVPALRDRVVVNKALMPMSAAEVQTLITQRLRQAGRQGDLFAPSAVRLLWEETGGMPRRVTILSLLALWVAYEEGKRQVTADIVQAAALRAGQAALGLGRDTETDPQEPDAAETETDGDGKWPRRLWHRIIGKPSD